MKRKEISSSFTTTERKKAVKWGNHIDILYSEIASSMKNPYKTLIKTSDIKKESRFIKSPIFDCISQQNKSENVFLYKATRNIDNEKVNLNSKYIASNLFEKPCIVRTDRLYQIISSYNDHNFVKKSNCKNIINDINKPSVEESLRKSWNNLYKKKKHSTLKITKIPSPDIQQTNIDFYKILQRIKLNQDDEKASEEKKKEQNQILLKKKLKLINETKLVLDSNCEEKLEKVEDIQVEMYPVENLNNIASIQHTTSNKLTSLNKSCSIKKDQLNKEEAISSKEKLDYDEDKLKQLEKEINDIDSSDKLISDRDIDKALGLDKYEEDSSKSKEIDQRIIIKEELKTLNENDDKSLYFKESKKILLREDSKICENSKIDLNNKEKEISSIIGESRKINTVMEDKSDNENMINDLRNISNTVKQEEILESSSQNKGIFKAEKGSDMNAKEQIQDRDDETNSEIGKLNSFSLEDEERKQISSNEKIEKISSDSIYNDFELKEEEIKEEI